MSWNLKRIAQFGCENEYDQPNKEERDPGTANGPSTDDHSVQLCVSDTGFSISLIYWGVQFFMALYVNTAMLYFNRFTILANFIL